MSDVDRIEVLVEGTTVSHGDFATILDRGEEMDLTGTDTMINRIEVRPAEDDDAG